MNSHCYLLVLLCLTAACLKQSKGTNSDLYSLLAPPNGTTLSAEARATNFTTIQCNIHTNTSEPRQVTTQWYLSNYRNRPGLTPIHVVHQDYNGNVFLQHGDQSPGCLSFSTCRNLLTVRDFLPVLNNTVLTCGNGDEFYLGWFPLVVYSAPGPPRTLTARGVGDTWVELSWQAPEVKGQPELSHYRILLTETDSNSTKIWFADKSETDFTIAGLLPSFAYVIDITGITELTSARKISHDSSNVAINTHPPSDVEMLRIEIALPEDCREWMTNTTEVQRTLEELVATTQESVQQLCNCSYRTDYLTSPTLLCSPTREMTALFKVAVLGLRTLSANQIVSYIQQFNNTKGCPEGCRGGGEKLKSLIIGVAVGVALLVLVVLSMAGIAGKMVHRRMKSKRSSFRTTCGDAPGVGGVTTPSNEYSNSLQLLQMTRIKNPEKTYEPTGQQGSPTQLTSIDGGMECEIESEMTLKTPPGEKACQVLPSQSSHAEITLSSACLASVTEKEHAGDTSGTTQLALAKLTVRVEHQLSVSAVEGKFPGKTAPPQLEDAEALYSPILSPAIRKISKENRVPQIFTPSKSSQGLGNTPRQSRISVEEHQRKFAGSNLCVDENYEVLISPKVSPLRYNRRAGHLSGLGGRVLAAELAHEDPTDTNTMEGSCASSTEGLYAEPTTCGSAMRINLLITQFQMHTAGKYFHNSCTIPRDETRSLHKHTSLGNARYDSADTTYAVPTPRRYTGVPAEQKTRRSVSPFTLPKTSSLGSLPSSKKFLKTSLKVTENSRDNPEVKSSKVMGDEDCYLTMSPSPAQRRAKPIRQVEQAPSVEGDYEVMKSAQTHYY